MQSFSLLSSFVVLIKIEKETFNDYCKSTQESSFDDSNFVWLDFFSNTTLTSSSTLLLLLSSEFTIQQRKLDARYRSACGQS